MYLDCCDMVKLTFFHVVMLHGRERCRNKENIFHAKNNIPNIICKFRKKEPIHVLYIFFFTGMTSCHKY